VWHTAIRCHVFLGRDEPAATIAGYTFNSITAAWTPEIGPAVAHLREVATYAYDQIDQPARG
jgi:hypothetical protein